MDDLIVTEIVDTTSDYSVELNQIIDQVTQLNLYLQLLVYTVAFVIALAVAWQIWKYIKGLLRSYIKFPI